jgi:hypothetical protein
MQTVTAKIAGYPQLSQEQQSLINEIKAKERELLSLVDRVRDANFVDQTQSQEAAARYAFAGSPRWASIAQTDFETGFMALVRSVAQPLNLSE